jgi:diketogulonate reductase-like aldo/keto reductase
MPIVEQVKALTASTEGISPNSKVDCFPVRSVPLNSGHCIPVIAYGTGTSLAWKDTSEAVTSALTTGLVHFDCAYHYKNQASTGRGISAWGGGREGLFVTTKGGEFDKDPKEGDVRKWLESCLEDVGGTLSHRSGLP